MPSWSTSAKSRGGRPGGGIEPSNVLPPLAGASVLDLQGQGYAQLVPGTLTPSQRWTLTAGGAQYAVWDEITPDAPIPLIERGIQFYKDNGCDAIVAVGGGGLIGGIAAAAAGRVRIIGWTRKIPRLLNSHHLVIGKAGGATVHEAIEGYLRLMRRPNNASQRQRLLAAIAGMRAAGVLKEGESL